MIATGIYDENLAYGGRKIYSAPEYRTYLFPGLEYMLHSSLLLFVAIIVLLDSRWRLLAIHPRRTSEGKHHQGFSRVMIRSAGRVTKFSKFAGRVGPGHEVFEV